MADFCERHCRAKLDLDVRRFVQFGILKGLLRYRGHHRCVARFVTHGPPHFVLAVVVGFLLALLCWASCWRCAWGSLRLPCSEGARERLGHCEADTARRLCPVCGTVAL